MGFGICQHRDRSPQPGLITDQRRWLQQLVRQDWQPAGCVDRFQVRFEEGNAGEGGLVGQVPAIEDQSPVQAVARTKTVPRVQLPLQKLHE